MKLRKCVVIGAIFLLGQLSISPQSVGASAAEAEASQDQQLSEYDERGGILEEGGSDAYLDAPETDQYELQDLSEPLEGEAGADHYEQFNEYDEKGIIFEEGGDNYLDALPGADQFEEQDQGEPLTEEAVPIMEGERSPE
jgi:hypothetical protein